jgi:hypothetical protein
VQCSTLGALSSQLSALTHLSLTYNPLSSADDKSPGVVASASNRLLRSNSMIVDEVQDCWAQLPALRSLQIGSRKVLQDYGWVDDYEASFQGGEFDDDATGDLSQDHVEPPKGLFIEGTPRLLRSVAALTGLTSLTLGPSAWLQERPVGDGLQGLLPPSRQLTGLQQLVLTLQVSRQQPP